MLLALLCCVAAYVFLKVQSYKFDRQYESIAKRDISELVVLTQPIFDHPPTPVQTSEFIDIDLKQYPELDRFFDIKPNSIMLVDHNRIVFEFAGGFFHYGYLITKGNIAPDDCFGFTAKIIQSSEHAFFYAETH